VPDFADTTDERTGEVTAGIIVFGPLACVLEHGAYRWTPEQRQRFANGPANLLAVQGERRRPLAECPIAYPVRTGGRDWRRVG